MSEDALVALQDDTHNQVVAQSVMLRIKAYVVEDEPDYESTPVVPPNDEYVSEDELDEAYSSPSLSMMAPSNRSNDATNKSRRCPRSTGLQLPDMRQGRPQLTLSEPSAMAPSSAPPGVVPPGSVPPGVVPPGAVPHTSVGSSSAVPAAPAPYVRRREDALLRAPSRHNQPHLHPDKINGALWFGMDPEVHAFIRAAWQGKYWGLWASWNFVPSEKKDQWWHAFIQHYYWEDQFHDEIYLKWKKQTQTLTRQQWLRSTALSKQKKKSAKAAISRKSAPIGKKMHKHGAGPRCFLNIEYKMMVDEGLDEPPSYTALAR
ncbi:hypothetical protein HID58_034092 [Brassica napus]|uniref:Uncharacterized protein n=1 Tax=Brassica napus TaxID=3708 RepID=A0ABQ8C134_BRANA|nr:hypothetical protein HID58_034092 [Brassica napus]